MQRQPVTSSNVVSIGYDPASRTLEIEFREQAIYQYFDVPADVSDGLLRAPSHGKFIWANIRDRYLYRRVDQRAS